MITLFESYDFSKWKEGDTIYCITTNLKDDDWRGTLRANALKVGKPYKLLRKYDNGEIYIKDDGAEIICKSTLFTKDKNHPVLVQKRFDL